ncbi:MAG: ATPase [Gammaproteobacteria bacterium]|nr:MAG: ATPase [Gammaproteobacteria bacterium]
MAQLSENLLPAKLVLENLVEDKYVEEKYVLGIDGGGTKTLTRLVNLKTQQSWQAQGGSSSLTNDFNGAIATIAGLCRQVVKQAHASENKSSDDECDYQHISAVFGLAGAGNDKRVQQLIETLAMPFAQLSICSDARTSAYGANNGEAVAVVALGTGSVGMRLDGQGNSFLTGGWGFIAGDEGGGAKLGLAAVKITLTEFECHFERNKTHQCELASQIMQFIGATRPEMLTWLSTAKPCDYAKFSPLVFALALICPVARKLLAEHIQAVEYLIDLTLANTQLPLVLLGGLAEVTKACLSTKYQQQLIAAKGDALDGACFLAQQFYITQS